MVIKSVLKQTAHSLSISRLKALPTNLWL